MIAGFESNTRQENRQPKIAEELVRRRRHVPYNRADTTQPRKDQGRQQRSTRQANAK